MQKITDIYLTDIFFISSNINMHQPAIPALPLIDINVKNMTNVKLPNWKFS
jgi:hypothetical protein